MKLRGRRTSTKIIDKTDPRLSRGAIRSERTSYEKDKRAADDYLSRIEEVKPRNGYSLRDRYRNPNPPKISAQRGIKEIGKVWKNSPLSKDKGTSKTAKRVQKKKTY